MSTPPPTVTDDASAAPPAAAPAPTKAQPAAHAAKSDTTPHRKNGQGTDHYATNTRAEADALHIRMAEELAGQWVGPMPVQTFLKTFVKLRKGVSIKSMPKFQDDFFSSLAHETNENDMYEPFMEKVKESGSLRGFQLVKTAHNSDPNTPVSRRGKPDISVYKQDLDVGSRLTRYESMELLFEFKPPGAPADPFVDDPKDKKVLHPFEANSKDDDVHGLRKKCRGQIASYAMTWCSRQHRTHCFMLWMGDPDARIIRFDRSGAIVSAKFNYRTESQLLLEFLWRFSMATEEVRGHDTTVSIASPEESEVAKAELQEWKPAIDREVLKMQIPDPERGTRPVFVWNPLAEPFSVTGRATRGYPGWDPLGNDGKGAVVWVKDSWRSCEEGMEKETEIIQELNKNGCDNVPVLICGDDLPNQSTLTKTYARRKWNLGARPREIVARKHIRFAQDFVGYHLETFQTSKQFIKAVFDAIIAHKHAYEKCNILHRDVSAGNILMRKEGGGVLNDWDLAKRVNKDPKARQPYRSGTWQFMSAAILHTPGKVNTVHDDMESFFWIVVYHILRYMNHTRVSEVKSIMENIFDEEFQPKPGAPICGGNGKHAVFTGHNDFGIHFSIGGNKPLLNLLRILQSYWGDWYSAIRQAETQAINALAAFDDLSPEDAARLHPFDSRNLAMHNYDRMIEIFDKMLAMDTWPSNDAAVDRLPQKNARKFDDIAEDGDEVPSENTRTQQAPVAARASKRSRQSQSLVDDADYPLKSGKKDLNVPPLKLSSLETVKRKEAVPNFYRESEDEEEDEEEEDEDDDEDEDDEDEE